MSNKITERKDDGRHELFHIIDCSTSIKLRYYSSIVEVDLSWFVRQPKLTVQKQTRKHMHAQASK